METLINNNYQKRIDNYKKVNTPEELLSFMDNNISYGIYGIDGKVYNDWENNIESDFRKACQTKYALCDKERILKYGLGTCWDQVELERFWFSEHNYNFKTFFIWFNFQEKNNYITHTYLVYEKNNKYYYFEHADMSNKGIKEFDSYEDAINYQMNNHIKFNKECGLTINDDTIKHIQVMEFNNPKYGCDMNEYLNNIIFNSKIIYQNNSFVNNYK